MPSTIVFPQSGGIPLMSGSPYSGSPQLVGGLQLKLAQGAPGAVYVGLPNLSGTTTTMLSGGSLSSGGLADGMELSPGDAYFIAKVRLVSGVCTPTILAPAASSGGRLFWDVF